MKLEHSPATDSRVGCSVSIFDARNELRDDLPPTPQRNLEAGLPGLHEPARCDTAARLRHHGEAPPPTRCPRSARTRSIAS